MKPTAILAGSTVQAAVFHNYSSTDRAPSYDNLIAHSGVVSRNSTLNGFSFKAPSRAFYVVFFVHPSQTNQSA